MGTKERENVDLEGFERRLDRLNEKIGGEEKKEGGTTEGELSRDFRMKSGNFKLDAGPGHTVRHEDGYEVHEVEIDKLDDAKYSHNGTDEEELPEPFLEFAGDAGISIDHRDDYLAWWECWCHGYNTAVEDIKKLGRD